MNSHITTIIGLGNPGPRFVYTRHNIGFRILDAIAERCHAAWKGKGNAEVAECDIAGKRVMLIKPQTFMNSSGDIYPMLAKQGIRANNVLVVHDELELPFGQLKFKVGGSHKGHNGLRSLIAAMGDNFTRLRFGIGRPEQNEAVGDYVLALFLPQERDQVEALIAQAVEMIKNT